MLGALVAVLAGLVLSVLLGWLVLSGVLAMTFRRARTMIRRMIERRREPRSDADRRDAPDRRQR